MRARAQRDIRRIAEYLENESGTDLADRFLSSVEATFRTLASSPRVGVRCAFKRPALRGLRRWMVKDFEDWLVFYFAKRDGVEIVRVVHGARDIAALLDD